MKLKDNRVTITKIDPNYKEIRKLADQIEHYVNTAHEGRVTVQTKVAAILRHNKHKEKEQ